MTTYMTTSNVIVLCAFAFYMLMMIVIGAIYSRSTKNNEDYFLGGRNLGAWTAALSAEASDMSGWLLMGLPGAFYLTGSGDIWTAIGLFIGTVLNWIFVSSRLRKYTIVSGNSLTIPSFFENRFKSKGVLKIVSAVIITIFFAVYTASAFSSGAKLFATLFGTDANDETAYTIGLIIAAAVILLYTFLGGFKAVCTTDLIQGMLMIVAILTVPIIAYAILTYDNSFSAALTANGVTEAGSFLNPFTSGNPNKIISGLAWGLGYFGMPHILVRFMAIKSDSEIKKSRKVAIIWVGLAFIASFLIGIIGRAYLASQLDGTTSETVFIRMIQQVFANNGVLIFIGGIFLCGILAAIMSTADSQLLVTASAISEDIYKGTIKKQASEKSALFVGRIAVIVIAIIAFLIARNPDSSIMDLVSDAWAGFGAAFGPVVLLALFWKRSNWQGALAGMISGALTVIVWDYIPMISTIVEGEAKMVTLGTSTGLYSLAVGFPIALVLTFIVSLCTKKPESKIVEEFESIKTIEA